MAVDAGGAEPTRVTLRAGDACSRPAGIRHDVMNGDAPMSFVEVERKG